MIAPVSFPKAGLPMQKLAILLMSISIILALKVVNRLGCGGKTVGYMGQTPEGGFSGIADITLAVEYLR